MQHKIINAISSISVPRWGHKKQYLALHYLGVVGQNHDLASDGTGAHYYIYWDGTIYQKGEPACGRMPYEPRFLMIRENAGGVYMAGKEADERSQYTGRKRSAAL